MNKYEFKQKTQEVLDQLEAKIEEMKRGVENIADDAREEYAEQMDKLGALKDELSEKLGKFDEIAESKWDVVRDSASHFFASVSEAWKEDFGKVRVAFKKGAEEAKDEFQNDQV